MNASTAAIDITPDFEVELSGFASRIHPCTGVLERIFARAIWLDDDDQKLLWIACDLIALERDFIVGFRAWAQHELGLAPQQVLICCTHTHSAPATVHLNAAGQYSEHYVEFLRRRLEDLARDAMRSPRPCDVIIAGTTLNLAIDRRRKPSAHVDNVVSVVAWTSRATGEYIGTIVNYAMHPVALGHVERRISPDWCGAASTTLSSRLGGIALVTNGAAGNVNPPREGVAAEIVAEYGRAVADAAIGAIESATPQAASLRVRSISVPIELEVLDERGIDDAADNFIRGIPANHPWQVPIRAGIATWRQTMKHTIAAGGGREVPIELQAIRIGDVRILAVNGEMFSRFTALLRERLGTDRFFVVGYANAAFGYIPTREAYAEGGYEVEQAHFFYNSFRPRIGTLETLVGRAAELLAAL